MAGGRVPRDDGRDAGADLWAPFAKVPEGGFDGYSGKESISDFSEDPFNWDWLHHRDVYRFLFRRRKLDNDSRIIMASFVHYVAYGMDGKEERMTCFENSDAEDMENFAVILAAGKRLAARVKALEWQPIETAPKDGSYIWLGSSSSVRVGFWRNGADYANHNSVGGGWIDICAAEQARGPNGLHFEPTHWMPTPQPPRTETAQQRPTSTETDVNEQGTEGDSGTNKAG